MQQPEPAPLCPQGERDFLGAEVAKLLASCPQGHSWEWQLLGEGPAGAQGAGPSLLTKGGCPAGMGVHLGLKVGDGFSKGPLGDLFEGPNYCRPGLGEILAC